MLLTYRGSPKGFSRVSTAQHNTLDKVVMPVTSAPNTTKSWGADSPRWNGPKPRAKTTFSRAMAVSAATKKSASSCNMAYPSFAAGRGRRRLGGGAASRFSRTI